LGLTLTSGRTFDQNAVLPPATNPNESLGKWGPEIVITRPLAEALFPGEDAVGKTVFAQIVNRPSVVVGVVESMQATPLEGPTAFFSEQVVFVSSTPPAPSGVYLVRTSPNSRDQVMARVNADLEKQQPGRLVEYVQSFSDTVDMVRAPVRASVFILVAISLLVIGVVGVGIAGLAAFEVEARIRQLGIRRALGANRSQLFTEVLFEYWLVSALGTVFGCILGASLSHKLQTNFPGLDPPFMYFVYGIAVAWCLCLIGVLLPARRAMLVSPATATRIP
jgi:putative ABC transport system permease protein